MLSVITVNLIKNNKCILLFELNIKYCYIKYELRLEKSSPPNRTKSQKTVTVINSALTHFYPQLRFSQLSSNIYCPRDCISRHNGGTSGSPIIPRDAVSRTANVERTVGINGLKPPNCANTAKVGNRSKAP